MRLTLAVAYCFPDGEVNHLPMVELRGELVAVKCDEEKCGKDGATWRY